jgi:hypothetical protein
MTESRYKSLKRWSAIIFFWTLEIALAIALCQFLKAY